MNRLMFTGVVCFGLATATGCAKKDDVAKPTQVIAKVNSTELSVHQLNFALQGLQVPADLPADQKAQLRKAALDRLVEQEALVQEAISKKVDRDPVVQQQLDAARKDILVRNHLQKVGATVAPPAADAVASFTKKTQSYLKTVTCFSLLKLFCRVRLAIGRKLKSYCYLRKQ